ncbi:MAG TPA: hypothetical protein VK181_02465 [Rhizobium sp.]|nr:hypothetical protein [Rhizobium sp.]
MSTPTPAVRAETYERDDHRCVSCGAFSPLEWNHREASGHGGRGKKAPELTPADGVTLCTLCNNGIEGHMQDRALALGWKIRRNRGGIGAHEIPYFDYATRTYYLPTVDGMRTRITHTLAVELLDAAGNLTRKAS